uniref:Fibronectin type-III domain-containing protein n=1 Tax=Amphimedon queenslandica TaxID=400682 RepID=A0A1X7UEA4_AMPQE
MATTVIWCLVLTGYLIVSATASVITQASPPYSPVCPNDELVLTCVFHGEVYWQKDNFSKNSFIGLINGTVQSLDSFSIYTLSNSTTTVITATNESIPLSANGVRVGCSDSTFEENKYTINISGPPAIPVSNISIILTTDDTLIMNWNAPSDPCIDYYNVTINSNNTLNESKLTDTTDMTINDLIIGTNYSFIIIPIDTIGREGPPSSLIQYIWNVPAQVVNISWDQISTDSITIWWNNTQYYSTIPVPPTQYYIISVYNTSNSIIYTNNTNDTNITITGLPLTDTNYTVTIIPVNVIGYGPSATVNVSASSTDSSSHTNTVTSSSSTTGFTTAPTTVRSTLTLSTMITPSTSTATASNAVPIISGAIGTILTEHLKSKISTDGAVTPTYDEIIVKPTTTTGVPIYDTPMELQANTAYGPINNKDIINGDIDVSPVLEVSLISVYINPPSSTSDELQQLLSLLPSWVSTISWTSITTEVVSAKFLT